MNQISHKQAIQWIDRRLDDLLTKKQLSLLDEHLHSCDSCRAYAAEMDGLPARLQNEFHTRWDEKPGPSQKVMQHITTRTRYIPMTNRIFPGIKLFTSATALLVLGFAINFFISQLRGTFVTANGTEIANNLSRSEDRLLAFASDRNGNSDIYTMRADGSGLTNLTNDPAWDGAPFWSPDGKQIAFVSDRSGSPQIYLMDAGGSNVTLLTSGEGSSMFHTNGSSPWSPDGTKLFFANNHPEDQGWKLYVLNVNEKTSTTLTNETGQYLFPTWSPDGEHIAFLYYESESRPLARHLFVVDKDGKRMTELTESLRIDETGTFLEFDYYWSPDGEAIFFTASSTVSQETTHTVYEAGLDGSLTIKTKLANFIVNWWEGMTLQHAERVGMMTWLHPDGSQSTLDICEGNDQISSDYIVGITYKRSNNGNWVLGSNCSASDGWMLYWANPDGTLTNKLLNSPIANDKDNIFNMSWSADDRFIAFTLLDSDASNSMDTLYVLDIEQARNDPSVQPLKLEASYGPSWQPIIMNEEVVENQPTPKPEQTSTQGGRVAFTAAIENGNLDIYTMRPDGSELINLTNHPAHDINPHWSPDGRRLAFESDRDGFSHIFLMDADGSNVLQLTSGESQHQFSNANPWSPDGSKLLFTEWTPAEEKWMLVIIDVNGQNKTPLTEVPNIYSNPSWSPDGQHVAFLADDSQNLGGNRLYVVDPDGQERRELTQFFQVNEQLSSMEYDWSPDGQSIFFVGFLQTTNPSWTVYEAGVADNSLIVHTTTKTPLLDWWNGISVVSPFVWRRSDEKLSTLDPYKNCHQTDPSQSGSYMKRSPNGAWLINVYCPNDDFWLYWVKSDGTLNQQLLDRPLPSEEGTLLNSVWSPGDKFVAFSVFSKNLTDMYILDMEASLNDPSIQPLKITVSGGNLFSSPSWQPVSNDETVKEPSTPEPEPTPEISSENRLIAVTCAGEYGNLDICLAHPDEPELTNVTNNPAADTNPFWSPDGKRIAFESDRSGTSQIYLMDADGSNVVQITMDEAAHYLPVNVDGITYPWSPEGGRILVLQGQPGAQTSTLISQNIKDGDQISLATGQLYVNGISWSPDGNYIGYLLDVSPDSPPLEPGIQVMDANGNNAKSLEEVIPHTERLDSRYRWSADGASVIFSATRSDPSIATIETIVYEYSLRSDTLFQGDLKEMGDWEEAKYLVTEFRTSDRSGLISARQYPDGNGSLLDMDDQCLEFDIRRSPLDNNFAIAASCPNNHFRLYWENSEKTLTQQLFDLSLSTEDFSVSEMVWSPDEKYIAFNVAGENNLTNMYVVNVKAILNNESLATLHEILSDGTEIYATNNPVQVTLGGGSALNYGAPSWQPIP